MSLLIHRRHPQHDSGLLSALIAWLSATYQTLNVSTNAPAPALTATVSSDVGSSSRPAIGVVEVAPLGIGLWPNIRRKAAIVAQCKCSGSGCRPPSCAKDSVTVLRDDLSRKTPSYGESDMSGRYLIGLLVLFSFFISEEAQAQPPVDAKVRVTRRVGNF